VRRLGVAGGVLIVTAALALAACGGSGDSSATAKTTATTVVGQQGRPGSSGSTGAASGGAPTTGAGTAHGTTASTPQGTSASAPHGATTSTQAATTTTRLNTIKPLPGRPPPPVFDYNLSSIESASPETLPNGNQDGVCRGPGHFTTVIVSWTTYNTDYVQLNGDRSRNYPPIGDQEFMSVPCDANHGVGSVPRAYVHFILFGPGGEATADAAIFVDQKYQP
jgi:hypothetical protein